MAFPNGFAELGEEEGKDERLLEFQEHMFHQLDLYEERQSHYVYSYVYLQYAQP